jgi:hypothetical protein
MTAHDASGANKSTADLMTVPTGKHRWTIRRMMAATAVLAAIMFFLRPVYFYLDASFNGPYTKAYDQHRESLAAAAQLVGKTEADAIRVLGEPVEIWEYDRPEGRTTTLAYSPSQFGGLGTFQVHCRGGIVRSVASQPN